MRAVTSSRRLVAALVAALGALSLIVAVLPVAPVDAVVPGEPNGPIVYDSNVAGHWGVNIMRPDGSRVTRLMIEPGVIAWNSPALSPDGSRILYQSWPGANNDLYVMNVDGTAPRKITDDAHIEKNAAWSPDGSKIAFVSDRSGNEEIYVLSLFGGTATNVTNNAAADDNPAWSPDGTKIAFDSDRGEGTEVFVMLSDGGGPADLTENPASTDWNPAWSPDGTEIAFQSDRDGQTEVYAMPADGDGETNLTMNAANDSQPAWSPDGTEIAFVSDRDGDDEVFVMLSDGDGQRRLTDNTVDDMSPDWGLDCGHDFVDVPRWVRRAVDWASCNGHMTGYEEEFRPQLDITRAQIARLLYRVAGSPDVSELDGHGFADVPEWVENAVRWMVARDIATGYPTVPPTFGPDRPITRAEFTRMQYRMADPTPGPPHGFSDVPRWVENAVNWIADPAREPPYATGYPTDPPTFRPDAPITRAETTRMTCRILGTAVC